MTTHTLPFTRFLSINLLQLSISIKVLLIVFLTYSRTFYFRMKLSFFFLPYQKYISISHPFFYQKQILLFICTHFLSSLCYFIFVKQNEKQKPLLLLIVSTLLVQILFSQFQKLKKLIWERNVQSSCCRIITDLLLEDIVLY